MAFETFVLCSLIMDLSLCRGQTACLPRNLDRHNASCQDGQLKKIGPCSALLSCLFHTRVLLPCNLPVCKIVYYHFHQETIGVRMQ